MSRSSRGLPVLFAASLLIGCASGSAAPRSSPNVLTGDQLRETNAVNVYDALRQLRPQWLRARASASLVSPSAETPIVYLHGIHHGPISTLLDMNIDRVRRVEFIDGRDATTRFGTGYGGGVIMVDLDRN